MPTHRSTGPLVALALAVSGVLASPLLVVSAIPGGTVTDPQGDAIGGGPDIASFSACHTETDLELEVNLFTPWSDETAVFVELDVDQNPNTGTPSVRAQGIDFLVSAIGHQSVAAVLNLATSQVIGGSVTVGPTSVSIRLPLSAIGGDDGVVDTIALAGALDGSNVLPISDQAPNAGLLTSVTCDGPVPTTTIPSTSTTSTLPAGGCTSNSECDDGNPCTEDQCAGGQCVSRGLGGGAGAECEVTQAADAVCSVKLQRTFNQKLAKARAAIHRAAVATMPHRKAKAKAAATSAVRALEKKAAGFAANGKISTACAQQIADAMQRLLQAIDTI